MVVAGSKTIRAFLFDDEPKAATATWRQCTLITGGVQTEQMVFPYASLKLENKIKHSTTRQILIKTTRTK
jgi:hypothetical protein